MAASTVGVTGPGPLSVTDKNGKQCFVPLSAFALSGGKVALDSTWSGALAATVDTDALTAVANARFAAGDLAPPPSAHPVPALVLTAVDKGPEGNGITVDVSADELDDVTLSASQRLVYPGLATVADAGH